MPSSCQDNEVRGRILELIDRLRQIFYETPDVEKLKEFSEEDVKVKLIFPLFEILGWNVRDYRETEMEREYGYDMEIHEQLLKKWPYLGENQNKGIKVDCVFKIDNEPHILLEAKRLTVHLPSPDSPNGARIVEYAKKHGVKFVVFTNFLKMSIIDTEGLQPQVFADFEDMSEYISEYDNLKVLMKPHVQEGTFFRSRPRECFENFAYRQEECDNCNDIQKSICKATTKLKQLGYELKPYSK